MRHFRNKSKKEQEAATAQPIKKNARGHASKITPEIKRFVHAPEQRVLKVPALQEALMNKFGITLSSCTIYKIWNNPLDAPKPTVRAHKSKDEKSKPGRPSKASKKSAKKPGLARKGSAGKKS